MIIPGALVVGAFVFVEVDEVAVAAVVTLDVGLVALDTVDRASVVSVWSLVAGAVVTKGIWISFRFFENNEKLIK